MPGEVKAGINLLHHEDLLLLGESDELFQLGQGDAERFLAQDVFLGLQSRLDVCEMIIVRAGNVDRIDVLDNIHQLHPSPLARDKSDTHRVLEDCIVRPNGLDALQQTLLDTPGRVEALPMRKLTCLELFKERVRRGLCTRANGGDPVTYIGHIPDARVGQEALRTGLVMRGTDVDAGTHSCESVADLSGANQAPAKCERCHFWKRPTECTGKWW